MIKRLNWLDPSGYRDYTPFMFLFIFALPFKFTYSNIVTVAYVIYVLYTLFRKTGHYSFDWKSFRAVKFLPALYGTFVISLLYSTDTINGASHLAKLSYLAFIPLLFCFLHLNEQKRKMLLKAFVCANLFAILFNAGRALNRSIHIENHSYVFDASVLGGQPFWYSIVQGGNYFFYDEFSYFHHPTYWALYLTLSVFIILNSISGKLSKRSLIFLLILLLVFSISIFLCSSRIIIVSVVILLTLYLIITVARKKSIYFLISGVILLIVLLTAIVKNPRFVGFESFGAIETFHHSRLEAWRSAFLVFKQNPFLGVGIGDAEDELMKIHRQRGYTAGYQNKYNEHNQYFQIANASGVPGLIAFLLSLGVGFRTSIRTKNYMQFAFMFSIALVCLVENILVRRAGIVYFAVFYCLLFIPSLEPKIKSPSL